MEESSFVILISVADPDARICRKCRKLLVEVIRFGLAAVLNFNLVTSISACGMGSREETTNRVMLWTKKFNLIFCYGFEDALGSNYGGCTIWRIRGSLSCAS